MKKYPNVPYFMLGHSMGSSLLRQYIQMYGKGLSGAIIMGAVADHKKGDACVREALMQADGGCARLALQKSFCGSFSCGKF